MLNMDVLCLKAAILTSPISVAGGALDVRTNSSHVVTHAVGRSWNNAISVDKPSVLGAAPPPPPPQRTKPWEFSLRWYPLRSFWSTNRNRYDAIAADEAVSVDEKEEKKVCVGGEGGGNGDERNGNWVLKILHLRSLTKEEDKSVVDELEERQNDDDDDDQRGQCSGVEECDVCNVVDEKIVFNKDSFLKLLKRVTLSDARLYAQMSYLGKLAYSIPQIKPGNLLKYHGLRFVTSSLEKKEQVLKAEKEKISAEVQEAERTPTEPLEVGQDKVPADRQETAGNPKETVEAKEQKTGENRPSAAAAYRIAASAASYLHSRTTSLLPFKSDGNGSEDSQGSYSGSIANANMMRADRASFMATTDSVTAVVAAKEEVKQAVADDLNSICSSPCEWFICDDDHTATRFFVIQGSESLASWKANLLFEPIQFEGQDVLVHRGIYEAAKGIYEQMLPEVRDHLNKYGSQAIFRFTGHSLGGSLSLLVNLMLLIRGEVPSSSLLPAITFGAPSIMCGGERLLRKLGLPRSHVQSIVMHRDIVPRAFSCNYPSHVTELLKAINGNFRNHPCLNNQRLLYAPMGEFLILQPDEKISPNHDLLPPGNGLYLLSCPVSHPKEAEKLVRAAQAIFLNSPHPLEILRERSAYGSQGTIQRDHDMNWYLKSVRNVVHQELKRARKDKRRQRQGQGQRRRFWWPLVAPPGINIASIVVGRRPAVTGNMDHDQFNFSAVLQTGRESLKRFSRLIASRRMHLLAVVFLFPARLLLLGVFSLISFSFRFE